MSDDLNEELPLNREIEISDGVFISRRRFVTGSLSSILAYNIVTANSMAQSPGGELISYQQFLELANPVAKGLATDTSAAGQDQYLHAMAAHAARIEGVPDPVAWNDSRQSFKPGTEIGFTPGGEGFTVLHWRMEPHTEIRLHRHDYGTVVTVGLGGEARVRNFEIVSENRDYVPGNMFRAQKTVDQQLSRGDINLVSLERNYIHGFIAGPEGAHGLDITTRIKPRPEHSTPYLAIKDTAIDESRQIYEAEWQE